MEIVFRLKYLLLNLEIFGNIDWVWVKPCVLQNLGPGSLLAT